MFSVTLDEKSFCSELFILLGWLLGSCCYPEQDNDLVCTQNGLALGSVLVLCTGLRRTLSFSFAYEQARDTESLKRVQGAGLCIHGIVQTYLALSFGVSQLIIYRMEFLVGALWYVPLVLALKRLRQEDCHNF